MDHIIYINMSAHSTHMPGVDWKANIARSTVFTGIEASASRSYFLENILRGHEDLRRPFAHPEGIAG